MSETLTSTLRMEAHSKVFYDTTTSGTGAVYDWVTNFLSTVDRSAKLPNWRRIIRQGGCATTKLTGTKYKLKMFTPFVGSIEAENGDRWWGDQQEPLFKTVTDPEDLDKTETDAQALTKFLQRSYEVDRAFTGMTFIGELRETLSMIRRPGKQLFENVFKHCSKAKKKFKRPARKRDHASVRAAIAGSWLEGAFGWIPLLRDIDDGMKALAYMGVKYPLLTPIAGRKKNSDTVLIDDTDRIFGAGYHYTQPMFERRDIEVLYRGRMKGKIDRTPSQNFAYWGISFQDVLPAVWELIPWSFVADYFTNIGDIIEAASYGSTHIEWADKLVRRTCVRKMGSIQSVYWQYAISALKSASISAEAFELEAVHVSRDKYTGTFRPEFHWELPDLGSRKWFNLGALAAIKSI